MSGDLLKILLSTCCFVLCFRDGWGGKISRKAESLFEKGCGRGIVKIVSVPAAFFLIFYNRPVVGDGAKFLRVQIL